MIDAQRHGGIGLSPSYRLKRIEIAMLREFCTVLATKPLYRRGACFREANMNDRMFGHVYFNKAGSRWKPL